MAEMIIHDNFGIRVSEKSGFVHVIFEDNDLKRTHVFVLEAGADHAEEFARQVVEKSQQAEGEQPPEVEVFGPGDIPKDTR